jgi:hypothetical protein
MDLALERFESSLNDSQKKKWKDLMSTPSPEDVVAFTAQLEQDNTNRKSRRVAKVMLPFLESVQEFSSTMDVFAQVESNITALVWGSARLVILVYLRLLR